MDGLRVERPRGGVALVVVDRPAQLNALDDALLTHGLHDAFVALDEDADVRAIVVTGAGRGFSSGADLASSGFAQPTSLEAEAFVRGTHRTPVAIRRLATPTIAAVNGPAVGAGFGLALACDLRLAAPTARFGAPFVGMGLVPDYGVSYFLPRVVGTATALDVLLTGRLVDAEEARQLGIVSGVSDDVVGDALDLAAVVAGQPPRAVAMTRRNVYRAMELDIEAEILEQEPRAQAVALHGSEFPERFSAWRSRIQGQRPAGQA